MIKDPNSEIIEIEISETDRENYNRLDQLLADKIESLSRSVIKNLFADGKIYTIDKQKLELKRLPSEDIRIIIEIPPPLPSVATPEDIPLDILFEDEHLLIVNKQAGLVTHPAPGNYTGTLVNAVLFHCKDLQRIGDQLRPGIVHRLDKGTSGVMVIAKNQHARDGLVRLFSSHDIKRQYVCLTMAKQLSPEGKLESTIGRHPQNRLKMAVNVKNGKSAITRFKVLEYLDPCCYLEMTLETGRTHQIRVHLSSLLRTPILMDPTYGQPKDHLKRIPVLAKQLLNNYPHPLLHAKLLGFIHPVTKKELLFEVEPPDIFKNTLEVLRGQKVNESL